MISWLLCDYGQVLCTPPPDDEWGELRDLAGGRDEPEFHALYWEHRPSYDRGDVSATEYWTQVIGARPAPRMLGDLVELDTRIWLHQNPDGLRAALDAAERTGARLALMSNAPVEVAVGIDALEWLAPFEPRFYSCDLGVVKPEPEAYHKVLAALTARPEEICFVDDRRDNVDAAASTGMQAVLFTGPADFARAG